MGEFTHFNQHGDAIMVDISKKAETAREAIAEGRISMNQECFDQLKAGSIMERNIFEKQRELNDRLNRYHDELHPSAD